MASARLARIDTVVAAGEHGEGAGGEACAMGGGVDAACEAGDDRAPRKRRRGLSPP
jgi:hypothetical protein